MDDFALTQEEEQIIKGEQPKTESQPIEPPPKKTEAIEQSKEEVKTEPSKEKQAFVPQQALHEARIEIKELKEKLKDIDGLKNEFIAFREANKPKPPTYEESPLDFTKAKIEELEAKNKEQDERNQETDRQIKWQSTISNISRLENEFRKTNPDYDEAFNYARQIRMKELETLGMNENDIANDIGQTTLYIVSNAMQRGKNPIEAIYNIAKLYGYKGKIETKKEETKEELETIAKGQTMASKSISGTKEGAITAEMLAEANDEDFNEMWKKFFGKK